MTEVTIMRRKNLGNYEHEEVSLTAVIEESDNAAECIASVKQEVLHALGLSVDPVPTTKPVEPAVPQAAKKTPAKKAPAKKVEEVKPEPAPVVEEVKPEPAKPVEKKAPAKKKAVKMVPYNRDEQSHKTEFAKVLVSINPNWQAECAQLAKAASVALNGTDMLDENGKVLGSFVEQVKAAITAEADL